MKLIVVGDSAVGKTCLISRFARDSFNPNFITTIGIDFEIKEVDIDGARFKLLIGDTPEQFLNLREVIHPSYFRGCDGILLVYDITKHATFENVERWLKELRDHAEANIVVMLVGNKSDLKQQRTVTTEEAMAMAEQHNLAFIETSALDASGVDIAFQNILTEIYRLMNKKQLASEGAQKANVSAGEKISLNTAGDKDVKKKKCGCN